MTAASGQPGEGPQNDGGPGPTYPAYDPAYGTPGYPAYGPPPGPPAGFQPPAPYPPPGQYGPPPGPVPGYPPAPGPYPYPYPYPLHPAAPPTTNTLAILSLVASIVGLACFVTSVVGIVLGGVAIFQIRRTRQDGYGLAVAGIVLGIITLVMYLVFITVA